MQNLISLVVQAGGKSRRMGEDKALKLFLGRKLIQRVVDRLAFIADEILVTTNQPYSYSFLGKCLIPDLIPGRGSLSGLYTAISSSLFPIVAVVACDMPFASAELIKAESRLLVDENVDVVIPRSSGGLELFQAVYRRATCLPIVRSAIEANQLKIIDLFSSMRVRELNRDEVDAIGPSDVIFRNINTPDEFIEAELLAQTRQDL